MLTRSKRILSICSAVTLFVAGTVSAGSAAQPQGWSLYNQSCFVCHGISKQGKSAEAIRRAIDNVASMSSMKGIAVGRIAAIAAGM